MERGTPKSINSLFNIFDLSLSDTLVPMDKQGDEKMVLGNDDIFLSPDERTCIEDIGESTTDEADMKVSVDKEALLPTLVVLNDGGL